MKKTFAVLSAIILILGIFSSCASAGEVAGEDLILSAREWYTSLDSAHVSVVNDFTGETEQEFIFKYDEKGVMTYSYVGTAEGIRLAQFNNGREQFTDDNGSISALTSEDLSFTAYSRDVPYPMADEGLILYYKRAVSSAGVISSEDGGISVTLGYDPEKLGDYDGDGEITSFTAVYTFDNGGNFVSLCEKTVLSVGGTPEEHSYTVYITDVNSVARVENVVDISSLGN